ncbi:conserved hypothetical protein [Methanococcus vannielii SB]|uniref:Uncharacterized protein n=1 Tax=Methanococcus vannielii (strain ATCC 35089 / DSM 1224 / JCM 13029 / OCM 148 / SB) TaxID=406327 RepID=A6USQ5_METVS|nr:DUF2540 domain-containing protein [Methanococcus vannielii]ABR55527.1 conserved hypothetical protein [Methanococcus vannielii SB]
MTQQQFYLVKDVDSRALRYYLHKLESLTSVNPEKLKNLVESKKNYKRTIKLSKQEQGITDKFGKATNILVNYLIIEAEQNE